MASTPPVRIGERLLPSLVDEIAQSDPPRVLYSVAKTKEPADGFHNINAATFARAVDRCSWYIENNLGRAPEGDFPTLAYMGPQDLVYAILTLACIKTGYKVLLNSPRNTLQAHMSLFEQTDCNAFLLPPRFPLPVVKQILTARPMRTIEIPSLQHWIQGTEDEDDKPYPYGKSFAEAKHEPFVVLHTSGSTGIPKAIVQTHATHSPLDAFTSLPRNGEFQPTYPAMCAGTRVYLAFPLFHCAGLSMLLPASIYAGFTVVLGPYPPTAHIANAMHVHGNVQHSCLAPMTLVDLAQDPEHLENLGRLKQVTFGGGPCPQAVGDLVAQKTRLLNCLGTTECGVLPAQLCDPDDWAYMSVSPVLGHSYRQVSEDSYEQVIVRDAKFEQYQGIFGTFPHLDEWPMNDLYSKHPTKDNVWLYKGRADDIIVFSTGEKLNPLDMENSIQSSPAVGAALVTGTGRFQASLLVEAAHPPANKTEKEALMDTIWPSVQSANKESPSHGRIHRHMILFTSADKPMLRAGKGTVQRKLTLDLYATELDALYKENEVEQPVTYSGSTGKLGTDYLDLQDAIKQIMAVAMDVNPSELALDADLFEHGLDSLQVTLVTREINRLLSAHGKPASFEAKTVYANPKIVDLAEVVFSFVQGLGNTHTQLKENREQRMERLLNHHGAGMPLSARKALPRPPDTFVVLLTGSTGSLGSYLLDALISDSRVTRIYCLNRGPQSLARQQKAQDLRHLQTLPDTKVKCIDADLSKPWFGLSRREMNGLLADVTTVIHNAWQVDFNLPLESFAVHVGIARRFIDFSAHSRFGAQLFFVSSISAVANCRPATGQSGIPEQVYTDWSIPQQTGYGESKFIAERLLDIAAAEADIPAVVCRVGQVAGPTTTAGSWPKQEWLPSLIASSKHLRKLPASLGRMNAVNWIPVDILGKIIAELATTDATGGQAKRAATVYHVFNGSQPTTVWPDLISTVARCLDSSNPVPTVSLEDWVDALRLSSSGTEDLARNPAIKLLDFFEDLVSKGDESILLDTKETKAVSLTLAGLGPVQEGWMENWMRQWAF